MSYVTQVVSVTAVSDLTLDQGGVRLSTWKGQSKAVTGYHTFSEFDYVSP